MVTARSGEPATENEPLESSMSSSDASRRWAAIFFALSAILRDTTAVVSRKIADKAKKIAAHLLEASDEDIELSNGSFSVAGSPDRAVTIQAVALAAYTTCPEGMEYELERTEE